MNAIVLNMTTYRRLDDSVADRVRSRLRGFAKPLVTYAIACAESLQRKTGCTDSEAVSAGVRWAKTHAGQPENVA